jgi:4'-phosphopantetheinyl transferase
MTLYPVVLPIAKAGNSLSGQEKVARLSRLAREALTLSASKLGVALGEIEKDENDVPRPFDGYCWSVSHKSKCVAAVISKSMIGIDIEEIKPRSESIFARVASEEEWELGKDRSWDIFFRYWTAKEATLKAMGIGIGGFKACRVVSIPDDNHIVLEYRGCLFHIEQMYFRNHIVSVLKEDTEIEWIIQEDFDFN